MKFKRDTPKKIVSLLLSVTYLLVTQPFFHDHDAHHEHHHHEAHEGAIHETDDCHNFIYHGVTQKGSHKHDHASADFQECLTCQFFKSNPTELPFQQPLIEDCKFESTHSITYIVCYTQELFMLPSWRGPPSFA